MLKINLNWDSSVTWQSFDANNQSIGQKEEAAFKQAVERAASVYENAFTNNVSVTIDVGWGELNGKAIAASDASAESHDMWETYTYTDVHNALIKNAQSGVQMTADATLPDPNASPWGPVARKTMAVSSANANALGLFIQNPPPVDGWIGFNIARKWTFNLYDTPAGKQSLVAAAEHEISEVLGRSASVGTEKSQSGNILYKPIDLFRYSSPNVRDLTTGGKGSTAYFSIDNGVTDLGTWNNYNDGYDLGDWWYGPAPGGHDAYGGGGIGLTPLLTMTDLKLMNVIGWNTSYLPSTVPDGFADWVPSAQTHDDFHILSGGLQEVGGTTHNALVDGSGWLQIDSGGQTFNTTLLGKENIRDGGTASGTLVEGGAVEEIKSGGSAIGTVLQAGGVQEVFGGGFVSGTVFSGGTQDVLSGATVSGADFVSGTQNVSSGGTAVDTFVGDFGYEWIKSGGSASGTTLSGGKLIMDHGGTASGVVIQWVGEAYVAGITHATTISAGFEEVESGGIAYDTVVSGGSLYVDLGGAAFGTIVSSGGEYVAGLASGTILDGGNMVVHGSDISTTINAASATLYDFGLDKGTTISAGREFVESGGVASGTIVSAGMLAVLSGGTANGTALDNGTVQVLSGGVVDGATVSGGAMLVQGTTNATTVDGGREIVGFGATANSTVIGDGTLEIGNGGAVGGATPVTFTSGGDGTLRIDASASFQPHFGPIAGFAGQDKIDLSDIAFGNNTTLGYQGNNTSGILTVGNGVGAAHLLMLGQYTAANFAIASDGHGGTLVTDPPLQQQPQQMLVHPHA
jgi:autotransporter passenger strand-loop-strand repeat protein